MTSSHCYISLISRVKVLAQEDFCLWRQVGEPHCPNTSCTFPSLSAKLIPSLPDRAAATVNELLHVNSSLSQSSTGTDKNLLPFVFKKAVLEKGLLLHTFQTYET